MSEKDLLKVLNEAASIEAVFFCQICQSLLTFSTTGVSLL